jgi:hypothetical protein
MKVMEKEMPMSKNCVIQMLSPYSRNNEKRMILTPAAKKYAE